MAGSWQEGWPTHAKREWTQDVWLSSLHLMILKQRAKDLHTGLIGMDCKSKECTESKRIK
jgi:hypothetical protein